MPPFFYNETAHLLQERPLIYPSLRPDCKSFLQAQSVLGPREDQDPPCHSDHGWWTQTIDQSMISRWRKQEGAFGSVKRPDMLHLGSGPHSSLLDSRQRPLWWAWPRRAWLRVREWLRRVYLRGSRCRRGGDGVRWEQGGLYISYFHISEEV